MAHGRHERWFGAMGTTCHVVVLGGSPQDVLAAEDHVRRLESLWSRFRDHSDVSRLNAAGGPAVQVDQESLPLFERAIEAWEAFDGWFDPFLQRELVAAGYDRDFHALPGPTGAVSHGRQPSEAGTLDRQGCPLQVWRDTATVQLRSGVGFDPGGIGKGLAADIVARALVTGGADGAMVNLGGDLCARGVAPTGGWRISIDDPFAPEGIAANHPVARVGVRDSALCTSTPLRRRWVAPDGSVAHHVLDPATGRPAPVELASLTVTAANGWQAEALTTAVMLAGPEIGHRLLEDHGAAAIVVHLDGSLARLGHWDHRVDGQEPSRSAEPATAS